MDSVSRTYHLTTVTHLYQICAYLSQELDKQVQKNKKDESVSIKQATEIIEQYKANILNKKQQRKKDSDEVIINSDDNSREQKQKSTLKVQKANKKLKEKNIFNQENIKQETINVQKTQYDCEICHTPYNSFSALQKHLRLRHEVFDNKPINEIIYIDE